MCTFVARGPVQWRRFGGANRRSERVKKTCIELVLLQDLDLRVLDIKHRSIERDTANV